MRGRLCRREEVLTLDFWEKGFVRLSLKWDSH